MRLGVWLFVGLLCLLRGGAAFGVWFGLVRSALLLAVVTCIVLSFGAMLGLYCFLCVTQQQALLPCEHTAQLCTPEVLDT